MKFNVITEARETLCLRQICEDFVNNLWVPSHYLPEQAEEFALDQFRRAVAAELEMLEVTAKEAIV